MPIFLLTPENVTAAKRALRTAMPGIRSTHLTEALAAGLGYGRHAALLSALGTGSNPRPAITDTNAVAFGDRLAGLGYTDIAATQFETVLDETVLSDTPYTVFKNGDRAANDRHYYACERRGRPMIMVKTARLYATLEWDGITVDTAEEDYLHDAPGTALGRQMFAQFQARARGASGKPYYFGSAFTGTIKKLLPETARLLADDYFRMLYLPLREVRAPRRGRHRAA